MSTKALREKRARAIEQARSVYDAVSTEGRAMNEDEQRKWDGWMDEADSLKAEIDRIERLEDAERSLEQSQGRYSRDTRTAGSFDANDALRGWLIQGSDQQPTETQLAAMANAGLTGRNLTFNLRPDALRSQVELKDWADRALSSTTGTAGGYLVPEDFRNELEVALLAFGGMRGVASVVRTASGADLPWPTVNDVSEEGEIVGQNVQQTEGDIQFGQRTLKAHKYSSKIIRVPVELIQDSAINIAAEVGTRLGERIGRITNRHFTAGIGGTEPEGIVTGAALGITATATDAVTYEELVDLQHSVNSAYRTGATFMFADSTLRQLKKLRDTDGSLIWQAGMAVREPDTILGHRYVVNDHMQAMGVSAKPILFGALNKYKIRDVQDVVLVRLDERYAEFGQVAFLAFSRHDGLLLDAGTGPVKYLQNAAV